MNGIIKHAGDLWLKCRRSEFFWFTIGFALIATGIFLYSVFTFPVIGVADNNDFSRTLFGIMYKDRDYYYSVQKFKFVASEYEFRAFPYKKLLGLPPALSPIYFVFAARVLSKLLGFQYFQLYILCTVAGGVYIAFMTVLYRLLMPAGRVMRILLALLMLFIFFDGTWLMWFNSLYGEPYIILGLLIMAAFFLICVKKREQLQFTALLGFIAGCFILVGAKMQAIVLYPVCAFLIIYLAVTAWKGRKTLSYGIIKTAALIAVLPLLLYYCVCVYFTVTTGFSTNKETLYHSVMFGLLMDADDPESVLDELGLDKGFKDDIGKHSYLSADSYTFAATKSEKLEQEFYDKIDNKKIAIYYLRHPKALWRGVEYLASKSLTSDTLYGKHTEEVPYGEYTTVRFSFWSRIRETMPKNIWFLMSVCVLSLVMSIYRYRKTGDVFKRAQCALFWAVVGVGILQFPLPYVFNGHADTVKQLFTFNYVFDICACVAIFGCVKILAGVIGQKGLKNIRKVV